MPCSLWLIPQPGPCFSFWVIFLIAVCLGEKAFLLFITVVSSWTDPIPGIPVLPFPLTFSPRTRAHPPCYFHLNVKLLLQKQHSKTKLFSFFFFFSEASPSEFPLCPFSIEWLLLIPSTFLSLLPFPCSFSSVQFSHSVMSDSLRPHES